MRQVETPTPMTTTKKPRRNGVTTARRVIGRVTEGPPTGLANVRASDPGQQGVRHMPNVITGPRLDPAEGLSLALPHRAA